MRLLSTLERFLDGSSENDLGRRLLVAFSGGPDSSALLWGLSQLRSRHRLELTAAHVDHALDPDSATRAERARALAGQLGVPFELLRRPVPARLVREHGLEAAARRIRYAALEELRASRQPALVLTAHHRDDQVETVLMRLAQGSGWAGLAGIARLHGSVARPLLDLPREELEAAVRTADLEPALDPTNQDFRIQRSRFRHLLVPYLSGLWPDLDERALAVARAALGCRRATRRRLAELLAPRPTTSGARLDLVALLRLPATLLPAALALLHRTAGATYPPPAAAIAELARQLASGRRIGSDCGSGWRWEAGDDSLFLVRRRTAPGPFTYTLTVPGVASLAEVSLRLRIERSPVAEWMFRGLPTKTGLGSALRDGTSVVVRNRRPGDRIQPLGCSYRRRLKDVLIDRRVPREERDRLPLICVDDRVAWVPGVAIDETYRIGDEKSVWLAELEPA